MIFDSPCKDFYDILDFCRSIYTGRFELEDEEELLGVYSLAHLYQVHDVLELISAFIIKMSKYYNTQFMVQYLNLACLYNDLKLKETCLNHIKLYAMEVLEAYTFTTASIEVVKLIFSLDRLIIDSDIYLVNALQRYLEVHPKARPKLEDAIQNIRFLTLEDDEIMGCQFLDTKIKENLVKLKNNPNLPTSILSGYSKNRNSRSEYKFLSVLPSNVVVKLYGLFNDSYCFLCKAAHSSFSCQVVLGIYKPYTRLSEIHNEYYSHNYLDDYEDDHIKSILQTFNKLAIYEMSTKYFDDFLDLF